jgi:hypothetical protein
VHYRLRLLAKILHQRTIVAIARAAARTIASDSFVTKASTFSAAVLSALTADVEITEQLLKLAAATAATTTAAVVVITGRGG